MNDVGAWAQQGTSQPVVISVTAELM